MTPNRKLTLSPKQWAFVTAEEDNVLFCGGIGGGKTHAGAVWAGLMIDKYPEVTGLITANTHSQLQKATLPKFFELVTQMGFTYKYNKNKGEIVINGTMIYALSMENYEDAKGINAGWGWGDECSFYKQEAFETIKGRIRDPRGPCQWKGTTTPNGFNWVYKKFVSRPLKSSRVIYASTTENLANLAKSYYEGLVDSYDTRLAQQELDGQFVNLSAGKVYHAFNRSKHIKPTDDRGHFILMGLDFNVHPMCGIYCYEQNGIIHVTKELYLTNSNTFNASKEILKTYPNKNLRIIPDETGNRRRSSAKRTDHEILRRAGLDLEVMKNPNIRDRYNNINRLFEQGKLVIDGSCKFLIEDLEQIVHDNKDDMLGHITDALGYACWYMNPLKKLKRAAKITYR